MAVTGTAPTPIDPAQFTFTAAWNGLDSQGQAVLKIVTATGQPSTAGLTWSEIVTSSTSPGVACGASTQRPADATGSITFSTVRAKCPVSVDPNVVTTWAVTISYSDPSGVSPPHSYPVAIPGNEP